MSLAPTSGDELLSIPNEINVLRKSVVELRLKGCGADLVKFANTSASLLSCGALEVLIRVERDQIPVSGVA